MSLGTFRDAVMSAALAADISLVSIMQAGDWIRVSTPVKHYLSTDSTTTNQYQYSLQHTILGLCE